MAEHSAIGQSPSQTLRCSSVCSCLPAAWPPCRAVRLPGHTSHRPSITIPQELTAPLNEDMQRQWGAEPSIDAMHITVGKLKDGKLKEGAQSQGDEHLISVMDIQLT